VAGAKIEIAALEHDAEHRMFSCSVRTVVRAAGDSLSAWGAAD